MGDICLRWTITSFPSHQAVKEYQKALEVIKSRKKNEEIWELVVWEYGTTLFTMGSLLQDHPPLRPQVGHRGHG